MVVEVRVLSSAPLDSVASLFRSWQAIRLALPFASRLAHGRPRYLATEATGVLPALSEACGRIEGSERSESKGTPHHSHLLRLSYGWASPCPRRSSPAATGKFLTIMVGIWAILSTSARQVIAEG